LTGPRRFDRAGGEVLSSPPAASRAGRRVHSRAIVPAHDPRTVAGSSRGSARSVRDGSAARKIALLDALARVRLPSARAVLRLHEVLLFLRAFPDDREVLARVERMLAGFESRQDLRRFRAELADTGVAGTEIGFSFFGPTASWLARRCPTSSRSTGANSRTRTGSKDGSSSWSRGPRRRRSTKGT
jgi:hypothetical protein